jgi:hypothetical protein
MSFLESIQHGLEKASQEASRITKIQHLHNVVNDLNVKATQEGQTLINKAMDMYYQGVLAQGELTAICQQIATYQQQLNEVHAELERLQHKTDEEEPQLPLPPQPAPQAYAPGAVPPYPVPPAGYPAYPAPGYPAPQVGYPYPAPAGYQPYPTAPLPSSGEPPTRPGAQTQQEEPPTQPLTSSGEPPTAPAQATAQPQAVPAQDEAQAQPAHHKPRQHHKSASEAASAQDEAPAAGTYANGSLPPIYSPFTDHPTGAPTASPEEAEKPAKTHHRSKKAAEDAPAPKESAAEK